MSGNDREFASERIVDYLPELGMVINVVSSGSTTEGTSTSRAHNGLAILVGMLGVGIASVALPDRLVEAAVRVLLVPAATLYSPAAEPPPRGR